MAGMICPRCKTEIEQAGEVDCDGETFRVWQCETCVVEFDFGGEKFPAAFTFATNAAGKFFDPETLEEWDLN